MIILKYNKQNHQMIIHAVSLALKLGKVVAYPTDTSYGLAVDIKNEKAVQKLYKIKERAKNKPVHIVVSSVAQAKQYSQWNKFAQKLAKQFWPGDLSLVLPVSSKELKAKFSLIKQFSAGTKTIGLRMPKNLIALDIVKTLKRPITATSANPSAHLSGGFDSYSAEDIVKQFSKKKYRPDIVIDAGKLPHKKPSTLVKIGQNGELEILRQGRITKKQIISVL